MTTPDPYMQRHKEDALVENVLFLRDVCGLHPDQIGNRIGMKWSAIEKILERRVERERR